MLESGFSKRLLSFRCWATSFPVTLQARCYYSGSRVQITEAEQKLKSFAPGSQLHEVEVEF